MSKKRNRTLADHVEAAERRAAPRLQARATGRGTYWGLWLFVILLGLALAGGAYAYLRFKKYI